VAIARALINKPAMLLADEPTGALDSHTTKEIMLLLENLHVKHGLTVVLVTHEPEIGEHCERIVRLNDGLIVKDETISKDDYRYMLNNK
jgi:putative ABC transport system ATP-binding protein